MLLYINNNFNVTLLLIHCGANLLLCYRYFVTFSQSIQLQGMNPAKGWNVMLENPFCNFCNRNLCNLYCNLAAFATTTFATK